MLQAGAAAEVAQPLSHVGTISQLLDCHWKPVNAHIFTPDIRSFNALNAPISCATITGDRVAEMATACPVSKISLYSELCSRIPDFRSAIYCLHIVTVPLGVLQELQSASSNRISLGHKRPRAILMTHMRYLRRHPEDADVL